MVIPQDNNYTVDVFPDITCINFNEDELRELKKILFQETGNKHIFYYIKRVYNTIKANLNDFNKIIIIPYIDENDKPHLNIQKLA